MRECLGSGRVGVASLIACRLKTWGPKPCCLQGRRGCRLIHKSRLDIVHLTSEGIVGTGIKKCSLQQIPEDLLKRFQQMKREGMVLNDAGYVVRLVLEGEDEVEEARRELERKKRGGT